MLAGGTKVIGETRISRSRQPIDRVMLNPRRARPLKETLDAIAHADLITMGPGSLYTSVIPHLLVEGIPQALAASPATKAYFANLMTQPGETTNMRASDHMAAILRHAGRNRRNLMDVCVVNTGSILQKVLEHYQEHEARPVENDAENIEQMGVRVQRADLVRMAGRRLQDRLHFFGLMTCNHDHPLGRSHGSGRRHHMFHQRQSARAMQNLGPFRTHASSQARRQNYDRGVIRTVVHAHDASRSFARRPCRAN